MSIKEYEVVAAHPTHQIIMAHQLRLIAEMIERDSAQYVQGGILINIDPIQCEPRCVRISSDLVLGILR